MAGHSKWKQIKHKKGAADAKRSKIFSKLSMAITLAAKDDPSPDTNPSLRAAIDKARENQMPNDNIERAIKRVTESKDKIDAVTLEAYGPEGVALVIEGITDNSNRTVSEIKNILKQHDAKLGEPGSAVWAFEKTHDGMEAKFPQDVSDATKKVLEKLTEELDDRDDVQNIYTNAA